MLHIPVLLHETLEAMDLSPNDHVVDATFGRGGHSRAILERLGPEGRLTAMDQDPQAIEHGQTSVKDSRAELLLTNFEHLHDLIISKGFEGNIQAILFDLGLSSPQLDQAERGFSFMQEGPLDMRMNPSSEHSAADLVNTLPAEKLAEIFKSYGEERFAKRIAQRIVAEREEAAITTTSAMAKLISEVYPKKHQGKHPATRCFQALRIAVNRELDVLPKALKGAMDSLCLGGRLAVISFHSLEDRIVKQTFNQHINSTLPRDLPIPDQDIEKKWRWRAKMIRAGQVELDNNPRARSAILRVIEKCG